MDHPPQPFWINSVTRSSTAWSRSSFDHLLVVAVVCSSSRRALANRRAMVASSSVARARSRTFQLVEARGVDEDQERGRHPLADDQGPLDVDLQQDAAPRLQVRPDRAGGRAVQVAVHLGRLEELAPGAGLLEGLPREEEIIAPRLLPRPRRPRRRRDREPRRAPPAAPGPGAPACSCPSPTGPRPRSDVPASRPIRPSARLRSRGMHPTRTEGSRSRTTHRIDHDEERSGPLTSRRPPYSTFWISSRIFSRTPLISTT